LKKAALIVFLVLLLDQALKIWVKTHMTIGQNIPIFGHWFIIHFTENEGMAFGMELGGNYGKLILSLFRIIAVFLIGWWLYRVTRKEVPFGLILSISLILAGATGNIIDSVFYGKVFNESTYMQMAQAFPPEGGYATLLYGKVVDMLYFPIIETHYPSWFPFFGGEEFTFFQPVFNIADSAITTGVLVMIIFQKKFFKKEEEESPSI
jgi:signal peptidase II